MNWYALDVESKLRQQEHRQQADTWRQAQAAAENSDRELRRRGLFLLWLGGRLEGAGRRLQARYTEDPIAPDRAANGSAAVPASFQARAIIYLPGRAGMPSTRPCQDEVRR